MPTKIPNLVKIGWKMNLLWFFKGVEIPHKECIEYFAESADYGLGRFRTHGHYRKCRGGGPNVGISTGGGPEVILKWPWPQEIDWKWTASWKIYKIWPASGPGRWNIAPVVDRMLSGTEREVKILIIYEPEVDRKWTGSWNIDNTWTGSFPELNRKLKYGQNMNWKLTETRPEVEILTAYRPEVDRK